MSATQGTRNTVQQGKRPGPFAHTAVIEDTGHANASNGVIGGFSDGEPVKSDDMAGEVRLAANGVMESLRGGSAALAKFRLSDGLPESNYSHSRGEGDQLVSFRVRSETEMRESRPGPIERFNVIDQHAAAAIAHFHVRFGEFCAFMTGFRHAHLLSPQHAAFVDGFHDYMDRVAEHHVPVDGTPSAPPADYTPGPASRADAIRRGPGTVDAPSTRAATPNAPGSAVPPASRSGEVPVSSTEVGTDEGHPDHAKLAAEQKAEADRLAEMNVAKAPKK